ncbi:MAG: peroxisome- protein [Cirrosporium novae-zelandiae]|nr:MAG: peroxisome- protein [Cirrosporium novae-zelandiae]
MSAISSQTPEGSSTPIYEPTPTVAAFSPTSLTNTPAAAKLRSTILIHQKSPLLIATPPQVTRALAYSHPFLLPLNHIVGLLTWTTGDPWESFLLLVAFWVVVLYGDIITRLAGPVVMVFTLMLGMYARRYSPLSSTTWVDNEQTKGKEPTSDSGMRHHKSLDEIVETLRQFTTRSNILIEPLLQLTSFLSTQSTAISATTRPALTTLFIRILLITPLWVLLTIPQIHILTPRRIVLITGTLIITWHSRPARVSRLILWRSLTVRRVVRLLTGLQIANSAKPPPDPNAPPLPSRPSTSAGSIQMNSKQLTPGIRFTFALYENQRRWLAIGWMASLFSYERAPWTDEHLNPAPSKDEFQLPDVEGGHAHAKWRWVEGSKWRVEGPNAHHRQSSSSSALGRSTETNTSEKAGDRDNDPGGWIYYDNKWNNGRRQDGWGRFTRRRKWWRDAELVEDEGPSHLEVPLENKEETDVDPSVKDSGDTGGPGLEKTGTAATESTTGGETASISSVSTNMTKKSKRKSWFRKNKIADLTPITSNSTEGTKDKENWESPQAVPSCTQEERNSARTKEGSVGKLSFTSTSSGPLDDDQGGVVQETRHGVDRWGVGDDLGMGLS